MFTSVVQQQQMAAAPEAEPEPGPWPIDQYIPIPVTPSPNHSGPRASTTGVVIHATRSGQRPPWDLAMEFSSTISWFSNPQAQVSAHAVVGGYGEVGFPIDADVVGWHDPSTNATHLGIEVCQPTYDHPYTERQYGATAALVREWAWFYGFAMDRVHIVGHEETPSGSSQGKSDPGYCWSWDHFMAMLG